MKNSDLDFFHHFIPMSTVDFTQENEVAARIKITSSFLDQFPIDDVGFEFVPLIGKLTKKDLELQVKNFNFVKKELERKHGVKVHASLHFPTASDKSLYLGSRDEKTRSFIMKIFDKCFKVAVDAGIETIVFHSGGNIKLGEWQFLEGNKQEKLKELEIITAGIENVLEKGESLNFDGVLALENVPYPFDIPRMSYTNIITPDFRYIIDSLEKKFKNLGARFGICLDLCHSWIISRTAIAYESFFKKTGIKITPPGIFPDEWDEFVALKDPLEFIKNFRVWIKHLHVADSRGDVVLDSHGSLIQQPTEGSELGTGDFWHSDSFMKAFHSLKNTGSGKDKMMVTLEIKDKDFSNPVMTARSLITLGERFM
ncbi:MAG: sugar phosphate isomerase/epimerase family protein [Promethearchaeota archaeon]